MIKNKKSKKGLIIACAAIIAFTGATVGLGIVRNDKISKNLSKSIMTINETPYNIVEYKYFYLQAYNEFNSDNADYLESFQIDQSMDYHNQQVFQNNQTWGDVVDESAYNKMAKTNVLYTKAISEGFDSTAIQKEVEELSEKFKNEAVNKNMTADQYASSVVCSGCKFSDIEKVIQKLAIANTYSDYVAENVVITDDDIEKYYKENSKNFDMATYRYFTFSADDYTSKIATTTSDTNEEVEEKLLKAAKQDAMDFFDKVVDEESFKNIALEYTEESQRETYSANDKSLAESSYVEGNVVGDWLFTDGREYKDTAVLYNEATKEYYVVMYIGRERNTNSSANARIIYLPYEPSNESSNITNEDKDKTKQTAQTILDEMQRNNTEENFSYLAMKYSKDINTVSTGGLITNVTNKSLVPDISNWLLDKGRKEGDITSLDVKTGVYVLYFKGFNEDKIWYTEISNELKNQKVAAVSGWNSGNKLEIKILE